MPPDNDPPKSSGPSQSSSGLLQDEPETYQSQGTVRRHGTSPGTYGSMGSHNTAQSEQHPPESSETSQTGMRISVTPTAQQDPGSPPLSASKLKKPALPRRATSRRQIPHRGQEFSVDDDVSEYEEEHPPRQSTTPGAASPMMGPLRKQTSTIRRRITAQPTTLPRVDSQDEEDDVGQIPKTPQDQEVAPGSTGEEGNLLDVEEEDDDGDISDAESFTLKDRQQAINETHPFGIRIWKPALYKKNRSVEKSAEGDIHSTPGGSVSNWLWMFNICWTLFFGWWLAIACLLSAIVAYTFWFAPGATDYGSVFLGLSGYLFWPFGQFVRLESEESYVEEDEGEGRSISEYEQWQSGDLEHGRLFFGPVNSRSIVGRRRSSMDSSTEQDSLLGTAARGAREENIMGRNKRRYFGRGQWNIGRVIFFVFFYFFLTPLLLLVSLICWMMVFWIPMGRVLLILWYHMRRRPLALSFYSDATYSRNASAPSSSILLCTYRAVGTKYWKYTLDGTNIFLINLLGIVLFTILDYFVLDVALGMHTGLASPALLFILGLLSIIPLAYFIGQAVASISAQSSMGLGAAVNAFFSTIVEVYLYCVALNEGKGQLVEGSIIGSIFAGILLLPGLSMCFGGIKRKTQRFNVKSAGVTSTMLLFAVIAAFGPTLFYQIYGSHELSCHACVDGDSSSDRDCRRCFFSQVPAISDKFFIDAVRPYCWFAAVLLFLSYCIGLWFTLRTHAAVIWAGEGDEKKPGPTNPAIESLSPQTTRMPQPNGMQISTGDFVAKSAVRESQLYKRILGQSLKQAGLPALAADGTWESNPLTASNTNANSGQGQASTPHVVPPKSAGNDSITSPSASVNIPSLTDEENQNLVRQVAEMAATAATVAARDAVRAPRKSPGLSHTVSHPQPALRRTSTFLPPDAAGAHGHDGAGQDQSGGGHDAPNWSKTKSCIILVTATVAYAIIAEILVDTVDVVLQNFDIDEKFLGITLFALVPNTTEFLNAISFAMNGNIALSMEIGSAYALQVCLLQIPALVLFSALHVSFTDPADLIDHTFNLIFPQWDMVTVILCVFLLSYMYGEGKSNYFKGSILVLTYLVVLMGFHFSGYDKMDALGVNRFDSLALGSNPRLNSEVFWTVGRGKSGSAY